MAQTCYDTRTNYWPASGVVNGFIYRRTTGANDGSDEDQSSQACYDCTIVSMVIKLATAPGVGKRRRFTLRKNGADTSLQLMLTGTETEGIIAGSVSFGTPSNSFDKITIKEELINNPAEGAFSVGLTARASSDRQVIVSGRRWATFWIQAFNTPIFDNNGVRWNPGSAGGITNIYQEMSRFMSLFSSAGIIRNLRVLLDSDPVTSGTNEFYETVDTDTSPYWIQTTDQYSQNIVDTQAVAAGGYLSFFRNIKNFDPLTQSKGWHTIDFIPTTAGHRIFNCDLLPQSNVDVYHSGVGMAETGDGGDIVSDLAAEPFAIMPCAGTIKNLYVDTFNTAPDTSEPLVITIRKNGVDTALAVTVTNPATTGNNTSTSFTVAAGDRISIKAFTLDNKWSTNIKPKIAWTFVADNVLETPIILTSFGKDSTVNTVTQLCFEDGIPIDACPYVRGGQIRRMVDNVEGLGHLEGETVMVQMDGNVPKNEAGKEVTNSFVVTDGTLVPALPKKAAVIHVGLGYDGIIKMLKSNDGSQLGTGQTKMRRTYMSAIRMLKTLGLVIGSDDQHLDAVFPNSQTTLFSGDQKKLPNSTWKEDTEVIIKQTKPLPAYILAVINRSEVEEKL